MLRLFGCLFIGVSMVRILDFIKQSFLHSLQSEMRYYVVDKMPHWLYACFCQKCSWVSVSRCFVHVPDEESKKLESVKMILVGYSLEKNGYKCFNIAMIVVNKSRCSIQWSNIVICLTIRQANLMQMSEEEVRSRVVMGRDPIESLSSLDLKYLQAIRLFLCMKKLLMFLHKRMSVCYSRGTTTDFN